MDELIKEFGGVFELKGHVGKFTIKHSYDEGIMGDGSRDDRQKVILGKVMEDRTIQEYMRFSVKELRPKIIIIDPLLLDPLNQEITPEKDGLKMFFIYEFMQNFPEASEGQGLVCTRCKYKELEFNFKDCDAEYGSDPDVRHKINKDDLLRAVELMFTDKWGKGLTEVPKNLFFSQDTVEDWMCQADAYDMSAFVQLAIFGEVVYG